MMKCICCLNESDDKKNFALTAADKKLYHNFTKIEFKAKQKSLKICKSCRESLKTSTNFLRACLESYKQLKYEANEKKSEVKRTRRKRAKEDSDVDEPPLQQYSDDDDELPISAIQQQLQKEKETIIVCEKISPQRKEQVEISEEITLSSTKTAVKFLCPECGVAFQTSQRLQIHSYTHSGVKNHRCEYEACGKSFATSFRLKAHTRTHTGEKPYVCDICSICFAQGNALKCHKRIHTQEKPFVCTICSKCFAQNTTLKTHMAALHWGKTVECDEPGCDKKFTRRSYLLLHKRDHEGLRKYACDRCPNQYKQKSHLDRHIEASHLGIRHKCDFPGCESEFSKSWSLKMHKFTHKPESHLPYSCSICNASFQRRDKYLKHVNRSHPKESADLRKNVFDLQEVDTKASSQENSNFMVLASSPEIYTIQNQDGSFTQVQTLQIVKEN